MSFIYMCSSYSLPLSFLLILILKKLNHRPLFTFVIRTSSLIAHHQTQERTSTDLRLTVTVASSVKDPINSYGTDTFRKEEEKHTIDNLAENRLIKT